jgi:hypothetical protein
MMLMSMTCELPSLLWSVTCLGPFLAAAVVFGPAASAAPPARTFADDVAFLRTHTSILVLADERDEAQVAVAPAWQGRVMPSTAAGGAVFFSGDGQYRSRIGVGLLRVRPILGSYDAANQLLTLLQFTLPPAPTDT